MELDNITNNFLNSSTPDTSANTRIFVASYYSIISAVGILLHLIVFIGILKAHEYEIRKLPSFYILLLNLYLADTLKLLLYLAILSPSVLADRPIFTAWIAGDLEGLSYSCIVLSTFMLSVNRALTIENSQISKQFFTVRSCTVCAVACWLLGVMFVMGDELMHCAHQIDTKKFSFFTKCKFMATSAGNFTNVTNYIWTYGVTVFYLRALYVLHKTRVQIHTSDGDRRTRKHQRSLFLQAFAVWLGLIANSITFRVIASYLQGVWFSIALGIFVLGQAYITPVCMLIFVGKVRRCTWGIIARKMIILTISKATELPQLKQEQEQQQKNAEGVL